MAIFKRKKAIKIKTDKMALPEVVRQIVKEKKLPTETRECMIQALRKGKVRESEIKELMAGRKKIDEKQFRKLGNIFVARKVPGLVKYSSGSSLLKMYIRSQEKKQARFRLFRQQREDEEKEALQQSKRDVSISDQRKPEHSALASKKATSSALENKQATTSAFRGKEPTSTIADEPKLKSTRIKPPF